ncbi:non-homologous end-joining DNA ligase [Ornithinimicrobium pratense]|uniref:ATP-dependent DNA ligase n=1 Tax=Ornithinimicrobium pratense TaxID=2593973 RepID=A0A5J6V1V2_9MICO|nr:non-homologous end-joining DNA ligase [Ornithinimicrobium pratense]QFG67628.1 ATP-dependent DNA ligase [Ornithinimicrobium pratense]
MSSQSVSVAGRTLKVSNLDKVLYPSTGTTKGEVLTYYVTHAEQILPELEGRPVTRIRWPEGVEKAHFFEKNLPSGAPEWLPRVTVPTPGSSRGHSHLTFPLVTDLAALVYLVNLGSLELHVPQWRVDEQGEPLPPDRLVVDLDPGPGTGLAECARVALMVRERLEAVGLSTRPVTSGSKGMQLYADLEGTRTSEEVSAVAKALAEQLAVEHPDLVTAKMAKSLRPGRIFLDWSQNNGAKTTICPWSLRGRQRPQVALPRTWDEVEAATTGQVELTQVTLEEV